MPSLSEGSPKVVLEAMGHSLPVIATAVGNIPTMLNQGQRGILVAQRDPNAIAEGVMRLVNDTAFRQVCIQEGYSYAIEHTVDKFVAQMAKNALSLVKEYRKGTSI